MGDYEDYEDYEDDEDDRYLQECEMCKYTFDTAKLKVPFDGKFRCPRCGSYATGPKY